MTVEEERKQVAWDMYFASIVAMTFHPGATRDGRTPPSVEQVARIADEMLRERDKRF